MKITQPKEELVKIKCTDKYVEISYFIAMFFITIRHMIEDGIGEKYQEISIPFGSRIFNILLKYLNYFIDNKDPMLDFPEFGYQKKDEFLSNLKKVDIMKDENIDIYEKWVISKENLSDFEKKFVRKNNVNFINKLIMLADFLNCPFIIDSFNIYIQWKKTDKFFENRDYISSIIRKKKQEILLSPLPEHHDTPEFVCSNNKLLSL